MVRPRKFDERTVLDEARHEFNRTGFHGTSVEDLSRATGLSKGSLYGAFGNKDALFKQVFDEYCRQSDEDALARVDGPLEEALDRLRDWLRPPVGADGSLGCLLAKGTAELAWEDPVIAARSRGTYQTLISSCQQLIEQAQQAGHIDPNADSAVLGGLIVTTHRGIEALAKAGVGTQQLIDIADAAVDSITLHSRRVGGA